jgi:hypothetical protein
MNAAQQAANLRAFIRKARNDKRRSDVAWGTGALHATQDKPANGERFGANHGDYLSGWCKVHGI